MMTLLLPSKYISVPNINDNFIDIGFTVIEFIKEEFK